MNELQTALQENIGMGNPLAVATGVLSLGKNLLGRNPNTIPGNQLPGMSTQIEKNTIELMKNIDILQTEINVFRVQIGLGRKTFSTPSDALAKEKEAATKSSWKHETGVHSLIRGVL